MVTIYPAVWQDDARLSARPYNRRSDPPDTRYRLLFCSSFVEFNAFPSLIHSHGSLMPRFLSFGSLQNRRCDKQLRSIIQEHSSIGARLFRLVKCDHYKGAQGAI